MANPPGTLLSKFVIDNEQSLEELLQRIDPVGQLIWRALPGVPQGWLLANGQQVTSTYPVLRQALVSAGNPYGTGGGNPLAPNYIGRFPRGNTNPGGTGGADTVTLTQAQMPSHTHVQNPHNHTQNAHNHVSVLGNTQPGPNQGVWAGNWDVIGLTGGLNTFTQKAGGVHSLFHINNTTATNNATTATNQNTGSGQAHENRPPFTDAVPLIRAY